MRRRLRDVLAGRSVDDLELGTGVWRRAHDRFDRAVDRFHQVIAPVPDGAARDRLELDGARLARCLEEVRERCVSAQSAWPSSALEIPHDGAGEHARISKGATVAAQAAQAATMVRVALRPAVARDAGAEDAEQVDADDERRLAAVDRAVAGVERGLAGGGWPASPEGDAGR